MCHLFCNIAAKRVGVLLPTCFQTLPKKLREYRLLIGQNYAEVTPYTGVTSLVAKQNGQIAQILFQKVELLFSFCTNVTQPETA